MLVGRVTPRNLLATTLVLASFPAACHCNQPGLRGGGGVLVAPKSVDWGSVYQGASKTQTLTLSNSGNGVLNVNLAVSGDSQFSLTSQATVSVVPGDHLSVTLQLQAHNLGVASASLQITGDALATVALTANVIADLTCPPPSACLKSHFDPNQGQCLEEQLPNHTTCDDGDPCTVNKACQNGLCKGTAVSCDDHNACTVDFCQPGVGCQHLDESARCIGNDPCQIYYCDPISNCQSSPVADHTPCASITPCQTASVCLHGSCVGTPILEGTSCTSPIDPCVTDATCRGGQCYSPTAAKLKPGDILWQVVSANYSDGDGGSTWGPDSGDPTGFWAAAAVDPTGNFYIDDTLPDGGGTFLVAYDVCGKVRWRDSIHSSDGWTNGRHVLASDVMFDVLRDDSHGIIDTILGQSQVDGTHLWSFDPRVGLGLDTSAGFQISDVALGVNGVFYYTGQWGGQDSTGATITQLMIGGLLRNGQSKFQVVLPSVPGNTARFGYPLLVDENQNLYTGMYSLSGAGAEIQSYDQTGALRFAIPIPSSEVQSFSENAGFFLEPVSLTAFDSNGRVVWSLDDPNVASNGHSPVVSVDDHLSILRHPVSGGSSELDNFDPLGHLVWSAPAGLLRDVRDESSVVLDKQGILYFVTENQLYAINEATGSPQWTAVTLPTAAPAYQGVLSLTPVGSLICSVSERLVSVFIGSPMANAPWPRFRGDNANRSSPPPNSGTPP
jgi:hypothetical protein